MSPRPAHSIPSGSVGTPHLVAMPEDFAYFLEKMVKYHFSDRQASASLALQDLKDLSW